MERFDLDAHVQGAGPARRGAAGPAGQHGVPGDEGVHRLVRQWVRDTPDAIAVHETTTGRRLSYAQLWEASGAVALALTRRGVDARSVVAVALPRGLDLVVAVLGIVRTGASYLPLDPAGPVARWTDATRVAGAAQVIVPTPAAPAPDGPEPVVLADCAAARGTAPDEPAVAQQPLCVYFTSGTTGRPKGVVVPHRAVRRLVTGTAYCPLGPGDVVASLANPGFDATTFEIWSTLAAGATVAVLADPVEAGLDSWLDSLTAHGVTTMFLTTSLFHMIARERAEALRSLHTLLVGGEQLELALVRRVLAGTPPSRLVNVYGPTETTTFATFYECTPATLAGRTRVPIGRPIQETWIQVVDDDLRPVPPGTEGELVIGGPGVALGYLDQPELTAARFVTASDGLGRRYRTGDRARQLECGAVEVLGRHDRQVKIRGFRIELPEIEGALVATGLVDVAVVEKIGEGPAAYLAAFVLPAPGRVPSVEDLRAALAPRLPGYMVPHRWQVRDALPLGPTGKVDRAALLGELDGPARPAGGTDDADTSLTDRITAIWRDVLGVDTVTADSDFIGLGGNSILAVQVSVRIRETVALPCEPMDVLLADDVAGLAARLGGPA